MEDCLINTSKWVVFLVRLINSSSTRGVVVYYYMAFLKQEWQNWWFMPCYDKWTAWIVKYWSWYWMYTSDRKAKRCWSKIKTYQKKLKGKNFAIRESLTATWMKKLKEAIEIYNFKNVRTCDGKILSNDESGNTSLFYD